MYASTSVYGLRLMKFLLLNTHTSIIFGKCFVLQGDCAEGRREEESLCFDFSKVSTDAELFIQLLSTFHLKFSLYEFKVNLISFRFSLLIRFYELHHFYNIPSGKKIFWN
jgi:hypothetical protein